MTNPVVQRLRRHGLTPRKDLGQHFLIDPGVLDRMVRLLGPGPETTLVELGAGLGVLTEKLLHTGARVVAVELDDALAAVLRHELGGAARFELLHQDLASLDMAALPRRLGVERLELVGNLPYQLTSTVLFALLELEDRLSGALFMLQREVAERVAGAPGSRNYGIASVALQAYYDIHLEGRLKPGAFLPPPRVESALVRLLPRRDGPALPWSERGVFIHLVRSVFNERRKVLRNTLKKFYSLSPAALEGVATRSGLDLGRRPEALAVEEFVRLLHALPEACGSGVEV